MDRLACVNVAALPLQLLLCRHPEWAALPAAVVEDDRPQALVLFRNAHARRSGVRLGQRYATALALSPDLRAGTVSRSQIEQGVGDIVARLRRYSPDIEPAADMPGVLWLDAGGLDRLVPSLHDWAERIRADLQHTGLSAAVAVGFSRFGTCALAMSHRGIVTCGTPAEEHARVQRVPLSSLHLDPGVLDRLLALGIDTVGGFLGLPGGGIRARFGPAAEALHRMAAGQRWTPLVPVPAEERHERSIDLDAPESHVERLVFVIKRLLDGLVATLAHLGAAVVEIAVSMRLDDRTTRVERVRPAAPTLEAAQLLTLVRLRLDTLRLPAGIVTIGVTAETCPAAADQQRLFTETRRDGRAANQALARIRAECGERSVVRARLCDAHLPSARFVWEPLEHAPTRSAPRTVAVRPLVRRIYTQAVPLASDSGLRAIANPKSQSPNPNVQSREPKAHSPESVSGPYVISGGWWGAASDGGVHREYYFVHTGSGELQWVYFDRRRGQVFVQGAVE